jgi:hypothetical protein
MGIIGLQAQARHELFRQKMQRPRKVASPLSCALSNRAIAIAHRFADSLQSSGPFRQ